MRRLTRCAHAALTFAGALGACPTPLAPLLEPLAPLASLLVLARELPHASCGASHSPGVAARALFPLGDEATRTALLGVEPDACVDAAFLNAAQQLRAARNASFDARLRPMADDEDAPAQGVAPVTIVRTFALDAGCAAHAVDVVARGVDERLAVRFADAERMLGVANVALGADGAARLAAPAAIGGELRVAVAFAPRERDARVAIKAPECVDRTPRRSLVPWLALGAIALACVVVELAVGAARA